MDTLGLAAAAAQLGALAQLHPGWALAAALLVLAGALWLRAQHQAVALARREAADAANALGNALLAAAQRGQPGLLPEAIAAYRHALAGRPRAAAPLAWAMTRNNLGNAFSVQGQHGDVAALREAVAHYEAALSMLRAAPGDYAADAEANLALTRRLLARHGG